MKLRIRKDQEQKTGLLGNNKGAKFYINFKVDLTKAEMDLINKYRVEKDVVYRREVPLLIITVKSLVEGQTIVSENIFELIDAEKVIQSSCRGLLDMITFMSTFGGEEVIDIKLGE
jgi:hypothetical protein